MHTALLHLPFSMTLKQRESKKIHSREKAIHCSLFSSKYVVENMQIKVFHRCVLTEFISLDVLFSLFFLLYFQFSSLLFVFFFLNISLFVDANKTECKRKHHYNRQLKNVSSHWNTLTWSSSAVYNFDVCVGAQCAQWTYCE